MADIINGTDLVVKIDLGSGAEAILCATTNTLSISAETVDIACKDNTTANAGWVYSTPGNKSWEITASALYVETTTTGVLFSDVAAALIAGTKVDVAFVGTATGSTTNYHGEAYVTSASLTADDNTPATWDVTLTGYGALATS